MRALLTLCLLGLAFTAAGCARSAAAQMGDRNNGKLVIARQACGSCHIIPGIDGADGMAGPSLAHFSQHSTVGGVLANTPDDLVAWLRHPQTYVPGNAMPDIGLTEPQARDVAAFLYSIP